MDIELTIHLERIEEEHKAVWWAESPEVDGFSVLGNTLGELRSAAVAALTEICGEPVELREQLAAPGTSVGELSPIQVVVPA